MHTIKDLRQRKGWSQEELGKKFNVPKAREIICRWETGKTLPNAIHLQELANIFKVSAEKILLK